MTLQESLAEWVAARGGLAHTRDAVAAGFTASATRHAVASGSLQRVRRSWLADSSAHPDAAAAVAAGGRLTCVSEARRLGLWVPGAASRLHVAVPPTSSATRSSDLRFHSGRTPEPVARTAWHEPPINVLAHVAVCVSREEALVVWESALRTNVVSPAHLERVKWASVRARTLADLASVLSDSGLETIVVERLRPHRLHVRQQVWIDGHPVDGLIGDGLVVQIDGFEHHRRAADRRRDIAQDARLVLLGYTVLRFDYAQILFDWPTVERTILLAVAQGLHRRR